MGTGNGVRTGDKIGNEWKRYKSRSVGTRSMAESGKRKGRKKGARRGKGWFYEVDAALVCDELAGFLINLTRDLSPFPSMLSPHSVPLFYNLPRANGDAYASYFFITSNDSGLLPFLLRLLIANEPREINRPACFTRA